MYMKKIYFGIAILVIIPVIVFGLFIYDMGLIRLSPCHIYTEVGEFEQKIDSEEEAKIITLNYFSSIGYEIELENLTVMETVNEGWFIDFHHSMMVPPEKICYDPANPPECIGQRLKLEEKPFGKNKIMMEYPNPC
jgi:hypothetical protein